jgi:hypothetical protein
MDIAGKKYKSIVLISYSQRKEKDKQTIRLYFIILKKQNKHTTSSQIDLLNDASK